MPITLHAPRYIERTLIIEGPLGSAKINDEVGTPFSGVAVDGMSRQPIPAGFGIAVRGFYGSAHDLESLGFAGADLQIAGRIVQASFSSVRTKIWEIWRAWNPLNAWLADTATPYATRPDIPRGAIKLQIISSGTATQTWYVLPTRSPSFVFRRTKGGQQAIRFLLQGRTIDEVPMKVNTTTITSTGAVQLTDSGMPISLSVMPNIASASAKLSGRIGGSTARPFTVILPAGTGARVDVFPYVGLYIVKQPVSAWPKPLTVKYPLVLGDTPYVIIDTLENCTATLYWRSYVTL